MKKLLLFTMLVVGCVSISSAQGVNFGVKAGVNLSSINGDYTDNNKAMVGFHVGALAEIGITEKFFFQPELLFSTQGAKIEESEDFDDFGIGFGYGRKVKLNYINVPLMGKFYVTKGLNVELGPQVGFLMSAKQKVSGSLGLVEFETEDDEDVKDRYKSIDFGVNFGAGYKLNNGLFFNARYNLGLANITDEDFENDVIDLEGVNTKNGVFQFSVGFIF